MDGIFPKRHLSGMGKVIDKAKRTKPRKAVRVKRTTRLIKLYDAKKFEGTVPSFANVTLEEMRAWRDDR
jgi:hypothetical protein